MKNVTVKDIFYKDGFVHVLLEDNEDYEMIYRATKGVYWDRETGSLFYKGIVSKEMALRFISEAMENEYFVHLLFE